MAKVGNYLGPGGGELPWSLTASSKNLIIRKSISSCL
jgi:hypothetical protein